MTADDASELLDSSHDKENLAVTLREDDGQGSKARRGNGEARKRSVRRRRVATDDEASDDASEGDGPARGSGFLDVLRGRAGPRSGDSHFSFQVHHHHAAQAGLSPGPVDAAAMSGRPDEKWMRRSTPYVLLGYVSAGIPMAKGMQTDMLSPQQLRPVRLAGPSCDPRPLPPLTLPLHPLHRHSSSPRRAHRRTARRDDPVREKVRRQLLPGAADPRARAQVRRVGGMYESGGRRRRQDEGCRRDACRGRERLCRRDQLQDDGEGLTLRLFLPHGC